MPIYAYRCSACGHAQDVLQKISDPLLTTCPACGAETYVKQLTAAGFQLKGSGWYVTDFRDGNKTKDTKPADNAADKPVDSSTDKPAEKAGEKAAESTPAKPPETAATKTADKAAAPAPAPAAPAPPPASGA